MKTSRPHGSQTGIISTRQLAHGAVTRRSFFQTMGLGAAALGLELTARGGEQPIQGFEKAAEEPNAS